MTDKEYKVAFQFGKKLNEIFLMEKRNPKNILTDDEIWGKLADKYKYGSKNNIKLRQELLKHITNGNR